jgi:N-acylneuraminate cytidylyltransferase/CMP-N,N'-diacetyllegionaminic acid synthase
MRVLAIIPARGGSKGIPKKNIINLNGKPLIQYTVDVAIESKKIDRVFLSSDDDEIISTVKELGVYSDYKRPDTFATDRATAVDVVIDALSWLEKNEGYTPDTVILLQPTSPLRLSSDIDSAIEQFSKSSKDCLVSVHEMIEHPYECVVNIDKDNWQYLAKQDKKVTRRQDYKEKFYYINGALYLVDIDFFKKNREFIIEGNTSFYVIPHERGIDIDEYSDLKRAEFLLKDLQ